MAEIYNIISLPASWLDSVISDLSENIKIFISKKELNDENKILKKQLQELELLAFENKILKNKVNYLSNIQHEYVTTRVVLENTNLAQKSYLINLGKKHGIEEGHAAISNNGLIGRVVSVGHNSSRILLITDSKSKIPAISLNSGVECVISGNHSNDHLELKYISNDSQLTEGSIFITSGEGGFLPYGINIGTIINKNGKYVIKPHNNFKKGVSFISIIKQNYAND